MSKSKLTPKKENVRNTIAKNGGRPLYPPVIDWKSIEAMCQIQCTQEEIASVVGCDLDTLQNRCKKENDISFSEFHKLKREGGKASLRRTQWHMAKTNPSLAIFLGKNYLKQTDRQEISGDPDAPLIHAIERVIIKNDKKSKD